jgi:ferredoxin/flavodoxin---NADP+ reductase
VVLGRRGPAQASFTTPEIRELGRLQEVDVVVDPEDLRLDEASQAELEEDRTAKANLKILRDYATRTDHTAPRRIVLRFLASPMEIIGADGRITALKVERNELVVDANGALRSKGTGEVETIPAGLLLRSIGYRTLPIEGVPFDPATSTINNIAGQVVHPNSGEVLRGEYVVGWAKRGPTGLIGNNKPDSAATVEAMLADLPLLQRLADGQRDPSASEALLRERGVDPVTYRDWQLLDRHEVAAGRAQGRPRVKVTTVLEMLAIIRQGR